MKSIHLLLKSENPINMGIEKIVSIAIIHIYNGEKYDIVQKIILRI